MNRSFKIISLVLLFSIVIGFSGTALSAGALRRLQTTASAFFGKIDNLVLSVFSNRDFPSSGTVLQSLANDGTYEPVNSRQLSFLNAASEVTVTESIINAPSGLSLFDQVAYRFNTLVKRIDGQSQSVAVLYDVPVKAQGTLLNGTACVPTAVSMVMDYYHQTDSDLQSATISQFIADLDPEDITPVVGISVSDVIDNLKELGYHNSFYKISPQINLSDLKFYLQDGPVIVQTGLDLGHNPRRILGVGDKQHALVLRGFSQDEQTVYVNDPWSGTELELSLANFLDMWNHGHNIALMIRA